MVLLSSAGLKGDGQRSREAGIAGYLSKPIAERDLVTEITRLRNLSPEQLANARNSKLAAPETKAA